MESRRATGKIMSGSDNRYFHNPLSRQPHLMLYFSSSEEEDVSDDEDWVESPDDLMATGSLESNDSGVSFKSDGSKAGLIDFKDRVSPRPDFSSSEEEDVSDDEDWIKSPDNQREDDILPYMYPSADDCDWMELADNLWMDFDSDVSAVEDFNKLLKNLEEMNQELSSEVGWKHLEAPVSSCS